MPKRGRRRRIVVGAVVALAMVMAIGAVVLAEAYWAAFLALLVAWLVVALTNLRNS